MECLMNHDASIDKEEAAISRLEVLATSVAEWVLRSPRSSLKLRKASQADLAAAPPPTPPQTESPRSAPIALPTPAPTPIKDAGLDRTATFAAYKAGGKKDICWELGFGRLIHPPTSRAGKRLCPACEQEYNRLKKRGVSRLCQGILIGNELVTKDKAFLKQHNISLVVTFAELPDLVQGRDVQRLVVPTSYSSQWSVLWSFYYLFILNAKAAWDQNQNVLLVPDQGITLFTVLHLVKDRNMTQEEAISAMKTQGLKFTKRMREKLDICLDDLLHPKGSRQYWMRCPSGSDGFNLAARDITRDHYIVLQHLGEKQILYSCDDCDSEEDRAAKEWASTFSYADNKQPPVLIKEGYWRHNSHLISRDS